MGFFSWITHDTNRSICNRHSGRPTFPVTMSDDKGNKWHERSYDGCGVFGDKDYYELLAEMNGLKTREEGIDLELGITGVYNTSTNQVFFSGNKDFFNWEHDIIYRGKSANQLLKMKNWKQVRMQFSNLKYPNLNEDPHLNWINKEPKNCPDQGYFY